MESGAYGAANAGGSFDLRRFLSQPQVVTRIVSMVSRPGGIQSRAPRPPGPVGRRLPSATGGCGRTSQAGRRSAGPAPLRVSIHSRPCVLSPIPLRGSGSRLIHSIPATPVRDVPRGALRGQARRPAGSGWGFGGHATAGGLHAALPGVGNSPGRDFLRPRGVQGGGWPGALK